MLQLSADVVVAGIRFHLLDERLARVIDEESFEAIRARLACKRIDKSIARGLWQSLSNPGRLMWLLCQSGTTAIIDRGGTARLWPTREGWPNIVFARAAAESA